MYFKLVIVAIWFLFSILLIFLFTVSNFLEEVRSVEIRRLFYFTYLLVIRKTFVILSSFSFVPPHRIKCDHKCHLYFYDLFTLWFRVIKLFLFYITLVLICYRHVSFFYFLLNFCLFMCLFFSLTCQQSTFGYFNNESLYF